MNICLRLVAKAEVLSFVQFNDAEAVAENLLRKGAGGGAGEFRIERKDNDEVDPGFRKKGEL